MSETTLDTTAVTTNLPTGFIGQRFLYHASINSTMDLARHEALQKAPEGTAVFAEQQTAGRGRLKRVWSSPTGNIAVSIVLYPPAEYRHFLIMLSSVAVVNAIKTVTGLQCQLKWPNDVQIDGKKVCGILIETHMQKDRLDYAVLGIGINVNMHVADNPELQPIAISLADKLGRPVAREVLLRQLFIEIERLYLELRKGNSLFSLWQNHMATLGKQVRVQSHDLVLEGTAESVAEDGCLLLRCPDGTLQRITIGDVSLRETK